jgi:hypothetical protein
MHRAISESSETIEEPSTKAPAAANLSKRAMGPDLSKQIKAMSTMSTLLRRSEAQAQVHDRFYGIALHVAVMRSVTRAQDDRFPLACGIP